MAKFKVHDPGEIPEQPSNRLDGYENHLIVFTNIREPITADRGFGPRDETPADVYVYAEGEWKELGTNFPVFFAAVQAQLAEVRATHGDDAALGGVLKRGAGRNPRAWGIVPADSASAKKALVDFDPDTVGVF